VILIGAIFVVVYSKNKKSSDAAAALAPWVPSATNMDPSVDIPGIYVGASVEQNGAITFPKYKAALHVSSTQRVAYDRFPPVGGPHDGEWAACNGVVYTKAVRDENMVHTLEHGAIWIAYNPDKLSAADISTLEGFVTNQQFISMSPYPTLTAHPISLQAWGHQLQVDSASDPRIAEFITALKLNQYTYPEIGATCDQPTFDTANPPAFDSSPRTASDVQLDGSGLTTDTSELMGDTGASSGVATDTSGVSGSAPAVSSSGSGTASSAAGSTAASK
jgi:hypothetical protein